MNEFGQLREETTTFAWYAYSSLLDAIFLIIWVLLQYATSVFIERFPLDDIDNTVLIIFRVLFAISTLIPVLSRIIKNGAIIYYRTTRDIKAERDKG